MFIILALASGASAQLNYARLPVLQNQEITDTLLKPYFELATNKKGDTLLMSHRSLNVFFADKISNYLSEASDLSLSRGYFVLDNSDGRMFLGRSWRANKDREKPLKTILTGGIKANVEDNFAAFSSGRKWNKDIGGSLKATFLRKGVIYFDPDTSAGSQKAKLKQKRYEIANQVMLDYDEKLAKYKKIKAGTDNAGKDISDKSSAYGKEAAKAFSQLETAYLESTSKAYNQAFTRWASIEIYVPFTTSTYKTMNNFFDTSIATTDHYPFEGGLTYTMLFDKKKWSRQPLRLLTNAVLYPGTTLLTFKASMIANNSVKTKQLKTKAIEQYLDRGTVTDTLLLARLDSEDVYVGNFETFWTPSVSARWVYMPLDWIGVSAAIEYRFGKANAFNWKMGVPVSLKDKEGKSKVNFELICRKFLGDHSVGLSIGLPIGADII